MDGIDELRSPSLPTSPAASIIVFPSPSILSVLQLLGTIRCPEKPRAAQGEATDLVCRLPVRGTPALDTADRAQIHERVLARALRERDDDGTTDLVAAVLVPF